MVYCSSCGYNNVEGDSFCSKCGAKISSKGSVLTSDVTRCYNSLRRMNFFILLTAVFLNIPILHFIGLVNLIFICKASEYTINEVFLIFNKPDLQRFFYFKERVNFLIFVIKYISIIILFLWFLNCLYSFYSGSFDISNSKLSITINLITFFMCFLCLASYKYLLQIYDISGKLVVGSDPSYLELKPQNQITFLYIVLVFLLIIYISPFVLDSSSGSNYGSSAVEDSTRVETANISATISSTSSDSAVQNTSSGNSEGINVTSQNTELFSVPIRGPESSSSNSEDPVKSSSDDSRRQISSSYKKPVFNLSNSAPNPNSKQN